MKQIVSICFLTIALLVLTALSLVPHHHHQAAMCTVLELCEADHAYNDRHTAHDTSGQSADEQGCVVHASYTRAEVLSGVVIPAVQPLQALGVAVPISVPEPVVTDLQPEYGLYIIAYRSASPNPGSGLRAPPTLS